MIPSQQYRFLRQSARDGRSINPQNASRWTKLHLDPWLLCFLILNAILGLMVVYSATSEDSGMVIRQAISFGVGFVVMFICAQVPPKVYQAASPYFYMFGIFMLLLVFVIGEKRLGQPLDYIAGCGKYAAE
jgi:Bacterial cell division membrane protein